jgi:D-glycero-D-manno-heptose 1,7-bisphosphate phosphatase
MENITENRYVALDRDGTIIAARHYLVDPDEVELLPGAAEGLSRLREMGLGLVVITNQSAIGRGYLDTAGLDLVHQRLASLLAAEGVALDGIYFCPHIPEDTCACRKPNTQLLESAAADLKFDPRQCFVIGDNASDIELGQRAGATTFLVRTGHGERVSQEGTSFPDFTVDGLLEAAGIIQSAVAQEGVGLHAANR